MIRQYQKKFETHPLIIENDRFAAILLKWNKLANKREMPWKGIADPYKIWLSEIILQQTRVDQGLDYYKRFIKAYPTIKLLGTAPETDIYKLWEGLGYYSRCKNLIYTAKYISKDLNGIFPNQYEEIIKLKGVGPYTAAAIASFAFNLPHAVVDGNVFRVISRVFGIYEPIDTPSGKNLFTGIAMNLLDKQNPGLYNQALMDLGATICKPAQPLCNVCPYQTNCIARITNNQAVFPIKQNKIIIKKRHFDYFILKMNDMVAIQQRNGKDIWQNLFEFIIDESIDSYTNKKLIEIISKKTNADKNLFRIKKKSGLLSQKLTHQHISCRFIEVEVETDITLPLNYQWVSFKNIDKYAFPGIINQYLKSLKN